MSRYILNLAIFSLAILSPHVFAYGESGCFTSPGDLTLATTSMYMSLGMCTEQCKVKNSVAAVQGTDCYCGNSLPPSAAHVSDAECNLPCAGFPTNYCGGSKAWTVMSDSIPKNPDSQVSPTVNPTATIPASILTAPSSSFAQHPGVAYTASASSSTTTSTSTLASSASRSASSTAALPSVSVAAAAALVRSVGAGSALGAVLVPLVMSYF